MNKLDKLVEDKIRAEGWIKLLPTEKCETSQPHRFRYADGQTTSVSIIQYGALAGVYQGPNWQERYKQVDWDTPECSCEECLVTDGLEESQKFSKAAAYFARTLEGTDTQLTVNIAGLQLEEVNNGYKQVSFYYKIPEVEINMTHDQLLEICKDGFYETNGTFVARALRAVVELHKPKSSHPDGWHEEIHCAQGDDQFHYPCPTIQAIEEQLK